MKKWVVKRLGRTPPGQPEVPQESVDRLRELGERLVRGDDPTPERHER